MPTMFEEEPKARCPDCSQSLTFIRTKSHQKRWYCYACEKYIDRPTEPTLIKDAHARIEALNGLQVIDSHGMIVGRVRAGTREDRNGRRRGNPIRRILTERARTTQTTRRIPEYRQMLKM